MTDNVVGRPDGVVPVSSIGLRELSEIMDEKDIFLSIYLPRTKKSDRDLNASYIRSRYRAIVDSAHPELIRCFESTMDLANDMIERDPLSGEKGLIIFASSCRDFIRVYRISAEPERKMVLDTSPYLLPLARLKDEYEDYGLLLMDSRKARLMIVRSSTLEDEASSSIDLMNRHKKGGMSQMRFNRLRRGAIHSFVGDVVEDLRANDLKDLRGIVVAGPGSAKKHLLEELPPDISDMVIGTLDVDMDIASGDLMELSDRLASADERGEEEELVKEFRASIMKGGDALYGVTEIRKALEQGRVDMLLILEGTSIPGWICERCQNLRAEKVIPSECPRCAGPTSRVEVVEELFELAKRTGAGYEFVKESPFLESVGGLGAILRYSY